MAKLDPTTGDPAIRYRRARLVAAALSLAVLATACSDDDTATPASTSDGDRSSTASSESTTSANTSAPSTSDEESVEDEIVARYVGFWEARFEANAGTPDPDDPSLREYATGEQLETVVAETGQRLEDGVALRAADPSRTDHAVTVVSVDADRAELQDCFVNDGVVYRVSTGEVVDDAVVTRSVSADMVLVEGAWKLERATVIQEWEGIAGCALAG